MRFKVSSVYYDLKILKDDGKIKISFFKQKVKKLNLRQFDNHQFVCNVIAL